MLRPKMQQKLTAQVPTPSRAPLSQWLLLAPRSLPPWASLIPVHHPQLEPLQLGWFLGVPQPLVLGPQIQLLWRLFKQRRRVLKCTQAWQQKPPTPRHTTRGWKTIQVVQGPFKRKYKYRQRNFKTCKDFVLLREIRTISKEEGRRCAFYCSFMTHCGPRSSIYGVGPDMGA